MTPSLSPSRRAWLRFKQHRLGYWSLVLFVALVLLSPGTEARKALRCKPRVRPCVTWSRPS